MTLLDEVSHGYTAGGDVRIHYAALGEGPLVVMIHGFPDYWYTWRNQMPALAKNYRVVAMDQRGYNLSGKPAGVDNYAMKLLLQDAIAVIHSQGRRKAIVVGHDWGGMVAWSLAMLRPDVVEKLIILNLPHPNGLARELAGNPAQRENSAYAREFQQPDAHKGLTAERLASWVEGDDARLHYIEAFERSSFEGMLNYYKKNYPREPYDRPPPEFAPVKCPVLMFHGLADKALLHPALNGTWEWIENDLTLVTIPGAGHFVQHDAADLVSRSMSAWLGR